MSIKTSELVGAQLDWAVAKCERLSFEDDSYIHVLREEGKCLYSTDWSQGGPIIQLYGIRVGPGYTDKWWAVATDSAAVGGTIVSEAFGPTPLIAAMRCYVASKLGDEVEIPKELA
jgi:hypothetical protein